MEELVISWSGFSSAVVPSSGVPVGQRGVEEARHHGLHGAHAVVVAPDRDHPAGPPQDAARDAVERREVEPVHGLRHRDEVHAGLAAQHGDEVLLPLPRHGGVGGVQVPDPGVWRGVPQLLRGQVRGHHAVVVLRDLHVRRRRST